MKIKQIEFQYKGNRDYIQGPDIFSVMVDECIPPHTPQNIHFTLHDFVRTNFCNLYVTESIEELGGVRDVSARCQYEIDGITQWKVIAADNSKKTVEKRYEYDEKKIVSFCSISGNEIILNRKSPYSFIETVVAMNKHMHYQLFPEATGMWIFTRIDLPSFCDAQEQLSLVFRHNMNFKLTKSDIIVAGQKVGEIFFSMVGV